jgi:hypothetical protein
LEFQRGGSLSETKMSRRKRLIIFGPILLAVIGTSLIINNYRTRPIYGIQTDYVDISPDQNLWKRRTIQTVHADGPSVNGLNWSASLFPEFTTADDISYFAQLKTATSKQLIFRSDAAAGRAYLLLTAEGQEPKRSGLSLFPRTFSEIESRQSGHEIAFASADLRVHFGRLKPGAYSLQLILPKSGYVVAGEVVYSPADIVSAKMQFRVVEPAIERAIATNTNPTGVEFIVTDEPYAVSWGTAYKARIINHRPVPIRIDRTPASRWAERSGLTGYQFELWRPNYGWLPAEEIVMYCTPTQSFVTVRPGRAVECYVDRHGGGIRRYKLTFNCGRNQDRYCTVYSNTVVLDRFNETFEFNLARQPFLFGLPR